ncbi:hypothetical protein E2562_003652 [Oryza meyeriana var. granulata]|uniref:Uncharacterized protein n=1 Tax=Oryza meyeriana var. granulata TaxID=110450 RepID=A0A6G1C2T2_9ORYZ|nr:hypothetical protein E2562_003652 [Oryza meyeriana var. granulata]
MPRTTCNACPRSPALSPVGAQPTPRTAAGPRRREDCFLHQISMPPAQPSDRSRTRTHVALAWAFVVI